MFTLEGTNISLTKALLKMISLLARWEMLVPWRVYRLGGKPRLIGEIAKLVNL